MFASVIFTTYNHPRWLEKTLWGFSTQSYRDFEIIVADNGSDQETRRSRITRTDLGIDSGLEQLAESS